MALSEPPVTSVVIPTHDEAADLERCLDAVLASDFPLDRLEVLVADDGSTDGTPAIAERVLAGSPVRRHAVLHNDGGSTPSNLNAGLAAATGEVVVRVDARSLISTHHVRVCVEVLTARPEVAVVGGRQLARARDGAGLVQRGIARGLNNRYGMGFSRYRRGAGSGPSDTVYLGAFRTAQLRAVGGWDERFPTNQDFELNRRLATEGLVWFDDRLTVTYLPRTTLRAVFTQYERFGRWKVRYWRITGDRPQPRQWLLLAAPPTLALVVSAATLQWPSTWRIWAPIGLALALFVEVHGSADHHADRGSIAEHPVAIASLGASSLGWLLGVLREALRSLATRSTGHHEVPNTSIHRHATRTRH